MATIKQKKAFTIFTENLRNNKPSTLGEILIGAGYSIETSKRPTDVTKSKGWQELMDEHLPDDLLTETHIGLLKTTKIEHMVFPLESPELTDDHIKEMLAEVNCKVRKIVHGEQARHVYYWVADATAREKALKLAYDIKGKLAKRQAENPTPGGNTYNTFIQQNNLNPNVPEAKELVQNTLDYLMQQTKWIPPENNTHLTNNDKA